MSCSVSSTLISLVWKFYRGRDIWMKRRSQRAIVGAIILSKTGIHFVALVLVNVQVLFMKPMNKRAGAKQSFL